MANQTACEVCGNVYDKSFSVVYAGASHVFDSFECAAEKLAPRCAHCKCRILGHGVESADAIFCCAHCAREAGRGDAVRDRA
jgi:hypothetical protein